jgi:DNA-binding transcriptional MerR regulator
MLQLVSEATLRIGELARRSGVSTDVLRAWERRYGLLEPTRTAAGYRLYSADDEARVRSMRAHLAQGLSAAEAARLARDATAAAKPDGAPADLAEALWSALDSFDDAGAQAAFDRLAAAFSTSPADSCAHDCSALRAAGIAARAHARSSPAPRASATTSG